MGATLGARGELLVGKAMVLESQSPSAPVGVVFEDDGETGYFYVLDFEAGEQPIQDALHIYNAAAVSDRDVPSDVQIWWSEDGRRAALILNGYPHAVADFVTKHACCRTGFPPPSKDGGWTGHEWTDEALAPFASGR